MQRLQKTNRRRRPSQQGFSLMELLIVITIIGVLMAIIVPQFGTVTDDGSKVSAKQGVKNIELALQVYQMHNANLPSTEQGLQALLSKPSGDPAPRNWQAGAYLKGTSAIPKDPWGNDFRYRNPGVHGPYDVFSLGKDGRESDDDIGNWNLSD